MARRKKGSLLDFDASDDELDEALGGAPRRERAGFAADDHAERSRRDVEARRREAEARKKLAEARAEMERRAAERASATMVKESELRGDFIAEPRPLPRPAPAPPPAAEPAPVRVERFPAIEAPSEVEPAQEFEVQVSLADAPLTPDVQVVQGEATAEGKLAMALPAPQPARRGWTIKVVLTAGAFDVLGPNFASIALPVDGGSTPAVFRLRSRGPAQDAPVYATFWHEHAFLGRAVKRIRVAPRASAIATAAAPADSLPAASPEPARDEAGPAPRAAPAPAAAALAAIPAARRALAAAPEERATRSAPPPAAPAAERQRVALGEDGARAPDLTLVVIVGTDPARPSRAEVEVQSPWLDVPRSTWDMPPDLAAVAASEFARLPRASARGIRPSPDAGEVAPADAIEAARGFGAKRWRAAPLALHAAVEKLLARLGDRFQTIQIVTNAPEVPWELMALDGGAFLGTRFRVARWHLAESGGIRPRPDTSVTVDAALAIAPEYRGAATLPAQSRELAAVRAALGGRLRVVDATRGALRDAIQGARGGVLHFAGHGEIAGGERPEYVLRLADAPLTSDDWRGMMRTSAPLLVFLNACDLGQASRAAGIVDGWAPAVLDAGGAGYIGGMWPLGDRAAADFAARFYAALDRGSPVSEAVRAARQGFFETGDPTYLAYVFYGSPHLVLAPPGR